MTVSLESGLLIPGILAEALARQPRHDNQIRVKTASLLVSRAQFHGKSSRISNTIKVILDPRTVLYNFTFLRTARVTN